MAAAADDASTVADSAPSLVVWPLQGLVRLVGGSFMHGCGTAAVLPYGGPKGEGEWTAVSPPLRLAEVNEPCLAGSLSLAASQETAPVRNVGRLHAVHSVSGPHEA